MPTYAIGDVHGCAGSLEELLDRIPGGSKFVFIGDIVNRGPETLRTIRIAMALGDRCEHLIGNHEMHLLAVFAGKRKMHPLDTIDQILGAPDCGAIIEWVRRGRFALRKKGSLLVHAATHWSWDEDGTLKRAAEAEKFLRSDDWRDGIGELFGKDQWDERQKELPRLRGIVNVFTRTRYLNPDGTMNYSAKLSPSSTDPSLIPWFMYKGRRTAGTRIVFGHWSTLGAVADPLVVPLDTGCLWGGSLTAVRLGRHFETISVKAPQYVSPAVV